MKTSAPLASWMATLWGWFSLLSKWIVNAPPAGAVTDACSNLMPFALMSTTWPLGPPVPPDGCGPPDAPGDEDGGGAGVALAFSICSSSHCWYAAARDRVDLEHHRAVEGAAQLRALAAVDARLLDRELELVRPAGHDVPLEQEARDVEGVDDVRADRA